MYAYGSAAMSQKLAALQYCANNPITYIDPTGHAYTCVGWGVEAAMSGGKKNANGCLGVQFVNLYKGIKKRYNNQSVHVYWSISGSLDATDGQDFAWDILDNPKSLLKTENLKSVVGYEISLGTCIFSKTLTKCAMGIGTYYKRKINERTKKASGRKR